MQLENLEKAVQLDKKLKFVQGAKQRINDGVCIFIGSEFRLDSYMEIHDEIKSDTIATLNRIEQEILTEIENL